MEQDTAVPKKQVQARPRPATKKPIKRRPITALSTQNDAAACTSTEDAPEQTPQSTRVDMDNGTYEVFHCCDSYMKPVQFHYHDFWEVYTFLSGTVTYHIEDRVYHLCAGDVLVIPPGKMHCPCITFQSEDYERIVLWLSLPMIETLDDDSGILRRSFSRVEGESCYLLHLSQLDFTGYTSLLHDFIRYEEDVTRRRPLVQNAYLVLLLQHLFNYLSLNDPMNGNDLSYNSIPAVIAYINEHLSEPLSLERISEQFCISKYHLIRKFKAHTNATVYDYILSKRISLAKRLMREGASATSACMQCGFSDYSNFYKSFQAKTGITPARFKKNVNRQRLE